MAGYVVAALYKFFSLPDPDAAALALGQVAEAAGVKGTLILAEEGINGTIAGDAAGIQRVVAAIRALPGAGDLEVKESRAAAPPFPRLKIRRKAEIVTMGVAGVSPVDAVGTYVAPGAWNELISAEDVVVIDTRNDYEVAIGAFQGAIDPGTASFRDFPDWWAAKGGAFAGKRVAMYCTGGIRCEKATSYLLAAGVEDVYHLRGGILKYLEEVPAQESLWEGACFVFDKRVSVEHGLAEGDHTLCHACGRPVDAAGRASAVYEEGVQCPACVEDYSAERKAAFRQRQRQFEAAKGR